MTSFHQLASPAPQVEAAQAAPVQEDIDGLDKIEPAQPCEEAIVEPAVQVEAAVTIDDPKNFAPPILPDKASHLSVTALRAGSGAEFESKAAVIKGRVERNFLRRLVSIFFDERDFVAFGEVSRFVLVKGNAIFVYCQDTDPTPLYTIQLQSIVAIQEDANHPDRHSFTISPRVNTNQARENLVTILLKDQKTMQQVYQITFDTTNDKSVAKRFMNVLDVNSKHYSSEVTMASVVPTKTTDK